MSATAAVPRRSRTGFVIFVAFMVVAFLCFIGLGVWQLERKTWKEGLIATLDRRLNAAPVALPPRSQWASLDPAKDEFRRVVVRVEFPPDQEARVYTGGTALREDIKEPGYFAFAPAKTNEGALVVIDRGFVPNPNPDASLRPIGIANGPVEIVGVLRWPQEAGWFVTPYSQRGDLWFVRDPAAMAQTYGWGAVAPFYIDQESPTPPNGFPRPGPLKPNLRNAHLQYAITWFGLALVLAVSFGFWLQSRRRI
jgi:cytochrome oxidase assembly protein ShyY1